MEKINLDESLKSALVELQEYLNLQYKYNKMLLAKRMGEVISYLALFLIVLGISGFLLFFLSFAFVAWFNAYSGIPFAGHLIVASFYLLLALVAIVFRNQLIFGPIRKLFGDIMFSEEEDHLAYEEAFKKTENLNNRLRKYKKSLKKKSEHLNGTFEELGNQLTISNIFQTVMMNAYNSFVTTSNIAKMAYSLVKRITSRSKTQKSKRKKRRGEIEE